MQTGFDPSNEKQKSKSFTFGGCHTPVRIVICGGGIAGASLACALSKLTDEDRISIELLEKDQEESVGSVKRGEVIRPEVTRILDRTGLLDEVKKHDPVVRSNPKEEVWHSSSGQMGTIDYNMLARDYPMLYLPHRLFVRSMHETLKNSRSVKLIYGAEANSVASNGKKSVVKYKKKDRSEESSLDCDLAVVADGGSSSLRDKLGISADFFDYGLGYLMVILNRPPDLEYGRHCLSPDGFVGLFAMPGNLTRAAIEVEIGELPKWLSYTKSEIRERLQKRRLPYIANLEEPRDVGIFYRVIRRQAREYHRPGIALVGDAAHTTHPMLGQGMSMVFNDVYTLSRLVSAGLERGKILDLDSLLARYESEAKAFADMIISNNDYAFRAFKEIGTNPDALKKHSEALNEKIGFSEKN